MVGAGIRHRYASLRGRAALTVASVQVVPLRGCVRCRAFGIKVGRQHIEARGQRRRREAGTGRVTGRQGNLARGTASGT